MCVIITDLVHDVNDLSRGLLETCKWKNNHSVPLRDCVFSFTFCQKNAHKETKHEWNECCFCSGHFRSAEILIVVLCLSHTTRTWFFLRSKKKRRWFIRSYWYMSSAVSALPIQRLSGCVSSIHNNRLTRRTPIKRKSLVDQLPQSHLSLDWSSCRHDGRCVLYTPLCAYVGNLDCLCCCLCRIIYVSSVRCQWFCE